MEKLIPILFIAIFAFIAYRLVRKAVVAKRERLIDTYRFPGAINGNIIEKYPHLDDEDIGKVVNGLREYFHLCNIAGRKIVSMPSQVVDVAWHELILFTRMYDRFCSRALGRFLHHTPAAGAVASVMAAAVTVAAEAAAGTEGRDSPPRAEEMLLRTPTVPGIFTRSLQNSSCRSGFSRDAMPDQSCRRRRSYSTVPGPHQR